MKEKTLRMWLGIIMCFSFLNLVQFVYFYAYVVSKTTLIQAVVGLFSLQFMWVPSVVIILLMYEILTKQIPYNPNK
jgi:hypothetical protein